MSLVKPNILAEALGITTDALRKRRSRVTKSSKLNTDAYDYTVTGAGRVMYQLGSLPPSVRAVVEKITTKRIKQKHEDLMLKDFRYANSLGKVNARRKKMHQAEVEHAARKLREKEQIAHMKLREGREPSRKESNYIRWIHQHEMTPNWKPLNAQRNMKKDFSYY
jgi:hypothetical protein